MKARTSRAVKKKNERVVVYLPSQRGDCVALRELTE